MSWTTTRKRIDSLHSRCLHSGDEPKTNLPPSCFPQCKTTRRLITYPRQGGGSFLLVTEQSPKLDAIGRTIPDALLPVWTRAQEVQDILTSISRIKGKLVKAQREKDALFHEVNFSAALGDLDKAWTSIQCAKPYALCPTCPSTGPKKDCRMCGGRGFISRFRWNTVVPAETKKKLTKS